MGYVIFQGERTTLISLVNRLLGEGSFAIYSPEQSQWAISISWWNDRKAALLVGHEPGGLFSFCSDYRVHSIRTRPWMAQYPFALDALINLPDSKIIKVQTNEEHLQEYYDRWEKRNAVNVRKMRSSSIVDGDCVNFTENSL